MLYGIIAAMEEEIQDLLKITTNEQRQVINGKEFIQGQINGKDVVIAFSGICKVNATITTTLMIEKFSIDKLIHLGVAGGLEVSQKQGDIVIGAKVAHGDVDATLFNYEYGQVPGMDKYFISDEQMVNQVKDLDLGEVDIKVGTILTQDKFMVTNEEKEAVINHFENPYAVDMESAAIAQCANVFNVPVIVIRSISDVVGAGESKNSFETFLELAVANSTKIVNELLK